MGPRESALSGGTAKRGSAGLASGVPSAANCIGVKRRARKPGERGDGFVLALRAAVASSRPPTPLGGDPCSSGGVWRERK